MFRTVWGSDRDNEGEPRPLDNTSYGHNIEFLWLFLHALEVLGRIARTPGGTSWRPSRAHTPSFGVDPRYGGVFVEGPRDGPARDLQKEFWQQAESLVGFLDAYLLLRRQDLLGRIPERLRLRLGADDQPRARASGSPCLDRDGTVRWDYLGHAWKNNYHTIRSMIQALARLRTIEERGLAL